MRISLLEKREDFYFILKNTLKNSSFFEEQNDGFKGARYTVNKYLNFIASEKINTKVFQNLVNEYSNSRVWWRKVIQKVYVSLAVSNAFRKILLVFGAGGGRDKGKRKAMAKIAEKFADQCIITTDNPRNENPIDIIKDISNHFNKKPIEIIDRKEAIYKAIEIASKEDLVLIAGKGNEEFQEIGSQKKYFSDKEVIEKFLQERKSKN